MDFWTYFNGFWIFPLLCLLFMGLMMAFGCHGMRFGCGHADRKQPSSKDESPQPEPFK